MQNLTNEWHVCTIELKLSCFTYMQNKPKVCKRQQHMTLKVSRLPPPC